MKNRCSHHGSQEAEVPKSSWIPLQRWERKKVVYVSCNPETLARDLAYMKKLGYKAKEAVGFDMFPATEHVETVVGLHRKDM